KPVFILDPSIITISTMTNNQPAAEEEENNGNNNNNNYNNDDDDMKLEPRSAAFVSNQPSRLSQQQEQGQQQREQQQQQQQASVYPYSVKIEQDTKGNAKISVHTYHSDINTVSDDAVKVFLDTKKKLQDNGVKVLEANDQR
ncbi:MAG TPA: hypothetical protein VIR31_05675, partial [Nitrososphaeraceae archaeon]